MRGICTGAAVSVFATAAGPTGWAAGAVGVGARAGVAGGGMLIGGAVCGNADVWSGASGDCGAAGTGATTVAGVRGAAIIGVSMAGAMRSPVSTRMAGIGVSFAVPGVACTTGGGTRGAGLDASTVAPIGGGDRCAGVAAVAGGSTAGNGNGIVLRTARVRGAASVAEVDGLRGARWGFASASSAARGFAAARRSGGLGGAGVSPDGGAAASVAGDFRLRGVFGRSISSMRQV
ncbi:MAG: hypothetical protein ABIO49_09935 [Dokdonella sp.]